MDEEKFLENRSQSFERRTKLLMKKSKEYISSDGDRLGHFYRAGCIQDIVPTEALLGMMTKHYTSIANMAKDPLKYSIGQWQSKIDDLANYCDLLDALVRDISEQMEG